MQIVHEYREERRRPFPVFIVLVLVVVGFALGGALGILTSVP